MGRTTVKVFEEAHSNPKKEMVASALKFSLHRDAFAPSNESALSSCRTSTTSTSNHSPTSQPRGMAKESRSTRRLPARLPRSRPSIDRRTPPRQKPDLACSRRRKWKASRRTLEARILSNPLANHGLISPHVSRFFLITRRILVQNASRSRPHRRLVCFIKRLWSHPHAHNSLFSSPSSQTGFPSQTLRFICVKSTSSGQHTGTQNDIVLVPGCFCLMI
jgi:hypothetical protein